MMTTDTLARVLHALSRGPQFCSEIAFHTHLSHGLVKNAIFRLQDAGSVVATGVTGKYRAQQYRLIDGDGLELLRCWPMPVQFPPMIPGRARTIADLSLERASA